MTGKGHGWGGSLIRPEATGFGCVYALKNCVDEFGISLEGKKVLISGSGNVAQYAAIKCKEFGAQVLTFSDSNGTIFEPKGFSDEQIQQVLDIKVSKDFKLVNLTSNDLKFEI